MQKLFFVFCILSIVYNAASAQKKATYEIKWGVVSQADREMKIYPLDSSADAVVLDDVGSISISVDDIASYKKHKRIKLLKKSAFESEGVVKIGYYTPTYENKEQFETLRAQVIYSDGTILPLSAKDFLNEKINDRYGVQKILFPALKEGCILEYEYNITGRYTGPFRRDWYFQENIPTRYSDFNFSIVGYYGIVWGSHGTHPVKEIPEENDFERSSGGDKIPINKRHFYTDSVPAVKPDAFMTNVSDYLTSYYLQLTEYIYPGQPRRPYLKNWDGFTRDLYDENFGNFTKKKNFSDAWKDLTATEDIASMTNDSQKIEVIHRFVKNSMDWNDDDNFYPQESLNKAYKQKKGSSADINMLMIALLNEAGVKTFPLILGTRPHGKPIEGYPIIDQYNYVLGYTELNGKPIFLDATDPLLPVNMPRLDALNGRGVVMDKKNPHWIDIVAPTGTEQRIVNFDLDKDRNISGTMNTIYRGYDAYIERHRAGSTEAFEKATKKYLTEMAPDIQVDSISKSNWKELNESYKTKVSFKLPDAAGTVGDVMYFNPTLFAEFKTNPFKQKERYYPVEIEYKQSKQLTLTFKIPEGFTVTDMPQNLKLALPGNDASFQYFLVNNNNIIQGTVKLNINRLQYAAENYKPLKEFFDQVAAKLNEQIVLKKK